MAEVVNGKTCTILYIINSGLPPDSVQKAVEIVRKEKGQDVVLEHIERLSIGESIQFNSKKFFQYNQVNFQHVCFSIYDVTRVTGIKLVYC